MFSVWEISYNPVETQWSPRRGPRGLVGEDTGCVWKRHALVVNRWRHSGWEFRERLPYVCVWGWGLCLRKDVYSGVANYLNRHSESRAQFGSVLHFLGTFDPSSLILTSTKICEHKVCPFSPWFLNLIMWRILKGYINIINHIISCMFK